MSLLQVAELSKTYDCQQVLHDISFSLEHGEILCLLGPSGSGKTTLLRLMGGLDAPDHGHILFDGRDMTGVVPHKRNFGMMFQEYALFPHKTVADNVRFGLEMHNWKQEEQKQRTSEMLSLVGLQNLGDRGIDALSGGERQRVALARSLAPQPRLLLLDEPLGSLDRILRDRLAGEIRSILKSQGVTAVFVTHDQSEAFAVADKIAILQEGKIEQFDSPETLYRNPVSAAVARFLGFQNILDFSEDLLSRPDSIVYALPKNFRESINNGKLLIRPDAFSIAAEPDAHAERPLIHALVKKRIFQGHIYQLLVQIGKQQLCCNLPIDPPPPQVGETITLSLRPSAMIRLSGKENS